MAAEVVKAGDDNDDRPLVPLGYDENGKPTGFTRLNPNQMEQFKDGGGDEAIREGKSISEVMMQGYENRKNAFTDFTSGISDGMTVLSQVQETLQLNQALDNIEPSSDGGRDLQLRRVRRDLQQIRFRQICLTAVL